jgi:leader peptidase (prepilin peptidase)/N-methyltransferase
MSDPWLSWLPPVVLAPFIGSFLGVLIRRLPAGEPILVARSRCESCSQPLRPAEMLPILSFAWQRGRCRRCDAPIARMHLAVECAALGVAGWAAVVLPDAPTLWFGCALGWTLLALGWIDWEHMILPDALTLPLAATGLLATWRLEPEALADHALAAALGYLAFRVLSLVYRRLRGHEGLGQGDAKLLAASGAWAGLSALPLIVFGAAVLGLCHALVLRLRGDRMDAVTALPFGGALALAFWVVWLYDLT